MYRTGYVHLSGWETEKTGYMIASTFDEMTKNVENVLQKDVYLCYHTKNYR